MMKRPFLVLVFLLILVTSVSASATPEPDYPPGNQPGVVTLTAEKVTSAVDIETAMSKVTRNGTRAGVVILDGKRGPFVYSGDDRSINIFYPRVTFRGINHAMFTNCADGFFFDALPADNIRIENLTMRCEGSFVVGGTNKRNITIQRNTILTPNVSIETNNGEHWMITENTIETYQDGVRLNLGKNMVVTMNHIHGRTGIVLDSTSQSHVYANTITTTYQGIALMTEAVRNQIKNNVILGVENSGVYLDPTVVNNTVSQNTVLCAWGSLCQTVFASLETADANKIIRNRP